MNLTIISGRSGSGKSVALRVLEDLGYYCIDNIPLSLLMSLTSDLFGDISQAAISLDARNMPDGEEALSETLDYLSQHFDVSVIYLDADSNSLLKRFSETRRLHPLTKGSMSLEEAIKAEKNVLSLIRNRADLHIDTTRLNVHELSELIKQRVLGKKAHSLVIVFESFGFKYGLPKDADYIFDARFLPNPHWEPELKPLTGLDHPVQQFFLGQPLVTKFIWQIDNFIRTWLPHIERNHRSYLTIAIGCTGGQHRSVYISEKLAESFRRQIPEVQLRHRELQRHDTHHLPSSHHQE